MLVLAALFCLVLIPMLGLAIDGSNVYLMRNQITMALDAAVLAANRSLNLGSTIDTQTVNATLVAQTTFAANISGMNPNLGTPVASFGVSQDPVTKIVSVTGSVSANLPLMMMGMIGFTSTPVNITATSQRRAVNIMLVLDHSHPMSGTPLTEMQADAITFINLFVNEDDNIGLVTFTGAPFLAQGLPNLDFQSNLPNDINSIQVFAGTTTNTAAAMSTAYAQLHSLNQPLALNVVVLFHRGFRRCFLGRLRRRFSVRRRLVIQPQACPLPGMLAYDQVPGHPSRTVVPYRHINERYAGNSPGDWLHQNHECSVQFPERHAVCGHLRQFHQRNGVADRCVCAESARQSGQYRCSGCYGCQRECPG